MKHAEVYSDASRDEATDRAGWACTVSVGRAREARSGVVPGATVSAAEIHAALAGLRLAAELGAGTATLYTDSTGTIAVIEGRAGAPAELRAALEELRASVAVRCVWVRAHVRHGSSGNARVDALARAALRRG
ncbi:MAG: hypothetical protein RLZZ387_892 [Chloroflexota bacterium]|jgi:ribonuclease HI